MGSASVYRLGLAAATVSVVGAGVISALPVLEAAYRGPCIALAVTYTTLHLLQEVSHPWLGEKAEHQEGALPRADRLGVVVFVLTSVIGLVILVMSRGAALLVVMPSISALVLKGSLLGSVLLGGVVVLVLWAVGGPLGGAAVSTAGMLTSAAAGITFVIAFSRVVLAERLARIKLASLAAELESANQRLREYAAAAEDLSTTKERNRIAREIHDGLGHCLTIVNVQLEAARVLGPTDWPRALECVGRAHAMAQRGLDEVRQSVAVLRERPADALPLTAMLKTLVDESRASGLEVSLSVVGDPRPLSAQAHTTLFRAAQEGLTNVRRHAGASSAGLSLSFEPAEVLLSLQDDGAGARTTAGGFGLLGLRERVQLIGGTIEVRTSPGGGFHLGVRVPA